MADYSKGAAVGGGSLKTMSRTESIQMPANTQGQPTPIRSAARPAPVKAWQTERPPPVTQSSLLSPKLRRGGTNTSLLNEAIWKSQSVEDDSTSSSSSSDDDDDDDDDYVDPPATKGVRKNARAPPASRGSYSKFKVGNDNYKTKGRVSKKDGRLNISVNETHNKGYLAKALGTSMLSPPVAGAKLDSGLSPTTSRNDSRHLSRASTASTIDTDLPRPRLNIVVMVIGSRGDIQPFLKLGKDLKEYGHRVRIATHPAFKDFVEQDSGLEFFSVGGDPAELMAFMVKNPGMIPKMETVRKGEIGRRREQMAEMFDGFWRACINATDDEKDSSNMKMMADKHPFVADAIIANPPSFAHIHCAERLGIPLHLAFTFPYTPTQAFPHPLANIKKTNVDPGYTNFMSYPLVEMMTWQGLGDLVNTFRVKTLGLEPVSTLWAPGQLYRLKVPYTYLWSPGLVPKPADWGPEIEIAGFVFLDLASTFEPPNDLQKFLDAGEAPVYIGFGSIVVDDPDRFTSMIFEAVKIAGVRALVSKGWGGLGDDNVPDNIFMLENTPHDWLFPKVRAVVHHGGAGTTAIGLKCGKPTMVVPFFGDQQFWGSMIGKAGAGAAPVQYKDLTAEKLAEGIKHCLTKEAQDAANVIARDIEAEGDGARNAVRSFHRSLVLRGERSMRCSILEERVAVWLLKGTNLRLSALAANILVEKKRVTWKNLRLIRHNEWNDFEGPGEPVTGVATALMGTMTSAAVGVGSVPFKLARSSRRRTKHEEKKKRKQSQDEERRSIAEGRKSAEARVSDGKPTEPQMNRNMENGDCHKDGLGSRHAAVGGVSSAHGETTTTNNDFGKTTTSGRPLSSPIEQEEETKMDNDSILSADPEDNTAEEVAHDVGSGLGQTAEALARAPMDLSLAVAQGFHNAPRLYGDTTVRRPTRITGIQSGLKAAGEEFVFGIYDGVTGLVSQPYTGARDNGALGFVKGVGMGLTGFVLKDIAAILGPFGYTLKGVHKEMLKSRQPTHYIRQARIQQGQRDLKGLSETDKKEALDKVTKGWSILQQVWALMQDKKSDGLKGRLRIMKERKTWRANGVFENIEMAERALEARKQGESLESIFEKQRVELEQAQLRPKNVLDDITDDIPRRGRHAGPGEN
ncbi:putative sterol glucosyltransferase [Coleophoma crateriformis]|uniref:Putative sterol glucosyltransferase n=1 Tax=Coleophoma crateriformis TaxID=565419 RepID=A0A3D8RDS4_9HELO|nr:putative sterol glucosyltransferase [Coleophoma crateriformis]